MNSFFIFIGCVGLAQTVIQISICESRRARICYAGIGSALVFLAFPLCVRVPAGALTRGLGDPRVLSDLCVFLIIESMLHLGVAWALVRQHFSEEASVLRRLGPLCPPVAAGGGVFVLEILFFEWGAGGAFWMQALLFSAGFFVLLTLGQAALGMAVPRWETRLELKVFTHVMLALLGMVLPLLVQGAGAIPAGVPVKGEAFAGTATLLLAGAAVGYLFQRRETVS